jgi:hypothetical protein
MQKTKQEHVWMWCRTSSGVAAVTASPTEVIPFHLEGLKAGGDAVLGAGTVVEWVEV